MSPIIIAIQTALGSPPFPALGATAERGYSVTTDIQDLPDGARRVVVVPADSLISRISRSVTKSTIGVQIAIQERPSNLAAQDAVVDLAESIAAVLLGENPIPGGKVLGDVIVLPVLADHLEEFNVHTAILTFTVTVQ